MSRSQTARANNHLHNPNKTETLVAGTCQQVAKLDTSYGIVMAGIVVPFSSKLRVLGVTLDEEVTFDDHISGIVRACNNHLRAVRHMRPLVNHDTANTIACSMMCTWLDYCIVLLYGVTKQKLQPPGTCPKFARYVSCVRHHIDRLLHVSVAVYTGSQCRN